MVIALGLAVLYLLAAETVYEAQADILVTPVPTQEAILSTVGVIAQSADPTLDVETANQLIDSPAVADRAAKSLNSGVTGSELLNATTVEPIPESNIVTVTARGPTAESAAARATAFAEAAVAQRRAAIASNIETVVSELRVSLAEAENTEAAGNISSTIATLSAFRASGNATIQVESPASPPSSPAHHARSWCWWGRRSAGC